MNLLYIPQNENGWLLAFTQSREQRWKKHTCGQEGGRKSVTVEQERQPGLQQAWEV